jgi:hypothetical protein
MIGYLLNRNIKNTHLRIREIMREVNASGVLQQTTEHRAIVRRQYYVQYSNSMWHIDTNMKVGRYLIEE